MDSPWRPAYKPSWRTCINPRCGETLDRKMLVNLCPSCRFIGKIGLLIGAVIAGILMKVFK